MKADHAAQLRLLDLQAADTTLAQLAHRRATLPELVGIAENETAAAELNNEIVDAETALTDIADEQRRLENEVDVVRTRATRDDARLQTGGLPSKELESLQHEITSLARRQGVLEDELLEVMEQIEGSSPRSPNCGGAMTSSAHSTPTWSVGAMRRSRRSTGQPR